MADNLPVKTKNEGTGLKKFGQKTAETAKQAEQTQNETKQPDPSKEINRLKALLDSTLAALKTLPTKESIDQSVDMAKNQIAIGEIGLPYIREAVNSINKNIATIDFDSLEKAFGMNAEEIKKSMEENAEYDKLKAAKDIQISQLDAQIVALNSDPEKNSTAIASLQQKKAEIEANFKADNRTPDPIAKTKFVVVERFNALAGAIGDMTMAMTKVAGISTATKDNADVGKKVSKVAKMITSGYTEMVKALSSTSAEIEANDIRKIIKWKDSGKSEFKIGKDGVVETREELNETTGGVEIVKVPNPEYYKPHFEAEEDILKIGEFITKLVQPIQKVAGMDLKKLPSPGKIGRQMNQLAGSMSAMVKSLVKSFSNIDTSGYDKALELLMGNQGTESVVEKINSYNVQSESETLKEDKSTKETVVSGKKASVIDVVGSFLDACNKITAFEFKPVIKKSIKFRGMAPVLGKAFRGVVRSMYSMIPSEQELNYDDATRRIQALNRFIADFNDKAFTNVVSMKIPVDKLYGKRTDLWKTKKILSGRPFGGILGLIDDICAAFAKQAGQGVEEKKEEASAEEAGAQLLKSTGEATKEIAEKENDKPTKQSDFQQGVKTFKDKVATIEDVLKTVISAKISSKEARKSSLGFIGARHAINRAISLANWIEKRMEKMDGSTTAKTSALAKNLSDTITSVEPAIRAMSVIALISEYTDYEGIDRTKYTICAFADSVEYLSKKELNFENLQAIQDGMSDTLKSVIKFMLLSKLVSGDKKWIDDMFSDEGAMTKFIDAVSKVYVQFEARQMQEPETMEKICICLNSLDESIDSMTKILMSARLLSIVAAAVDVDALSKRTLGSEGPVIVLIESVRGVLDSLEKNNLDEKGIHTAKNNIDELDEVTRSLIGIMLGARILSAVANSAKNADGEKSKKLLDVLMTPINELGKEETYDTIKLSLKSVLLLSLELLILTGVLVLVGTTVGRNAMQVLLGMGLIALMALGSILIMQELAEFKDSGQLKDGALAMLMIAGSFIAFSLSILLLGLVGDLTLKSMMMFVVMVGMAVGLLVLLNHLVNKGKLNKEGMPEICMPLLLIAGSFLLFSMSILMLGLVQDLTLASLGGFILMVGLAVGILFLLSRLKSEVIKGSLALMIAGAAFIMFSVVIAILARVAEDSDFVEMLVLVGIIAALVGVAVLAGFAIIPLALGSLGLILLSAALLVFSVAITALYGVSKFIGKDAEEAISPLIDTIDVIVDKMSAMSMKAIAVATANSLLALVMVVSMLGVAAMIRALKAISPKPNETEEMSIAMQGVVGALNTISKELSKISIGDMTKALVISTEALLMLVPLSIVALILLGFSRMRMATEFDDKNKPVKWESLDGSSFDRVGEVMVGLAGALNTVSKELSKISIKEMSKAMLLANEALVMMLPLSIVALILLGFSRLRIATEFDDNNKPVKWESLDGSSFDRVGDTMSNMVNAINSTVHKINEVGLVEMTKAVAKSVEMLAMMASLSGIMAILVKMGSGRIPVEFDDKNKPTRWEDFDSNMIGRSVGIAKLLVKSVGDISTAITEYDTKNLKNAKKNAKTMKGILKPISSMLDLVIKLTSGPISYGPCDEEGNPIGKGDEVITGNLGDYLKTHKKQVENNIETLIGIFNIIAEKVSGDGGIGKVDKKSLKRAKKNMGLVGQIVGSLQPMIDLITSLTSGQFNVGTEEEPKMMNLGDYISEKKPEVTKNLENLFDFIVEIGKNADKMNEGPSNRELRRANRKMGKIGDIIESLNAPLDLIMKMSDGEFEIKDDEGNIIEKMNLGKYIATKSADVESNLDALIIFIGHIGDKINTELNGENSPSKRDLKKANKKTGLIGDVLSAMTDTLDIIEKMASGQIQVGVDENGNPITQNLDKFLSESSEGIRKNIGLLIDFIVGPNGIQSHLDQITGEKSKTSEKKQNAIATVQSFADTIDKILDMTVKMGKAIDDPKTKDLFGTDQETGLKGRLGRLMEGYSVPLDDNAIFAHSEQFSVRYNNLARYNDLLKNMMKTENVDNWRKTVDATGDMVKSINSINDTKIDKLNTLMVNMQKFGETLDEALKDVFDKVVELAEELHYIIEADMKKNNPEEYKRMKQQEQRSANPLSPKNNQPEQPANIQQRAQNSSTDLSTVENQLRDVIEKLEQIASK